MNEVGGNGINQCYQNATATGLALLLEYSYDVVYSCCYEQQTYKYRHENNQA
jgi:hypothetical protein